MKESNIELESIRSSIRTELEETRAAFHALLGSLSEADWHKPSLNPGLTNGEILCHITYAMTLVESLLPAARFWGRLPKDFSRPLAALLDLFTGRFNRINEQTAREWARSYTRSRLAAEYDRVHQTALNLLAAIGDDEWRRGMYYPTRWDPLFSGYRSLEDFFRYPEKHFKSHAGQIAY